MAAETIWMTPAALERLRTELADLLASSQPDASRVRELRTLIERAETSQKPDDGLVEPGMRITVRYDGDGTDLTFLFGDRELVRLDDTLDLEAYSPDSPLGRAINGTYVGDTVTVTTPQGSEQVTITEAVPFG